MWKARKIEKEKKEGEKEEKEKEKEKRKRKKKKKHTGRKEAEEEEGGTFQTVRDLEWLLEIRNWLKAGTGRIKSWLSEKEEGLETEDLICLITVNSGKIE